MQSMIKTNYRPKEASEYLGVCLSTVWLYIKQGKLQTKKISNRVTIIKKIELDNLINSVEV
jgi:predicted site-specific integrase-resolvase